MTGSGEKALLHRGQRRPSRFGHNMSVEFRFDLPVTSRSKVEVRLNGSPGLLQLMLPLVHWRLK
jgi:hypothetical protein